MAANNHGDAAPSTAFASLGGPPPPLASLAGEESPAKRRRGAQPGNRLAQTHGRRARELKALKARVRAIIREANVALAAYRTWKKNGGQ